MMKSIRRSLTCLLALLALCGACASVVPAVPVADSAADQTMDLAPLDDGPDVTDRAEAPDVGDAFDGGDSREDTAADLLEEAFGDAPRDAASDWPVLVLHVASGEECNALQLHAIVNVIRRSGPFSATLAGGRMRDGVYWLTQSEHFQTPTAPDAIYRLQAMTLRVVGARVEIGFSYGFDSLFPQGVGRNNCLLNERGAPGEQCPFRCPEEKRRLGFSPFGAYEATTDQVRLWSDPYLYTFTWMGPP
jgi:hypothetical protein